MDTDQETPLNTVNTAEVEEGVEQMDLDNEDNEESGASPNPESGVFHGAESTPSESQNLESTLNVTTHQESEEFVSLLHTLALVAASAPPMLVPILGSDGAGVDEDEDDQEHYDYGFQLTPESNPVNYYDSTDWTDSTEATAMDMNTDTDIHNLMLGGDDGGEDGEVDRFVLFSEEEETIAATVLGNNEQQQQLLSQSQEGDGDSSLNCGYGEEEAGFGGEEAETENEPTEVAGEEDAVAPTTTAVIEDEEDIDTTSTGDDGEMGEGEEAKTEPELPEPAGVSGAVPTTSTVVLEDTSYSYQPKRLWKDVAYTTATSYKVAHYYNTASKLTDLPPGTDVSAMPEFRLSKIFLEPDTVYKFRVAGVNGCGTGPFSDEVTIRTPPVGLPPAPDSISVVQEPSAVRIGWRPGGDGDSGSDGKSKGPNMATFAVVDPTVEYLVYMSVGSPWDQGPGLQFVRVYRGRDTCCRIPNKVMRSARIDISDRSRKPAIIFRITAKNKLGDGPSTQVRWVVDDDYDYGQTSGKRKRKFDGRGSGSGKKMAKSGWAPAPGPEEETSLDDDGFKRPKLPAKRSVKQMSNQTQTSEPGLGPSTVLATVPVGE